MSVYPFYLPTKEGVPLTLVAEVDKAVWTAHVLLIASVSVSVWDWLVCLKKEYFYIWKRDFSVVTAVYILTRYGFFVSSGVTIYIWLGGWDEATCQSRYRIGPSFMASVELAAMSVLFLRTWAVWRKAWYIAAFCISLMLTYVGLQVYIEKELFQFVPIFRSQGPCIASGRPHSASSLYFAWPLLYDLSVTILLMIKLVPLARKINMSDTLKRLFREGVMYAVVLSCINAANTALLQSSLLNNAMLVPISFVMQATLTSRMILSLRSSGESQDMGLETKSFWSRVRKNTMGNLKDTTYSVNIVQSRVVETDGGVFELDGKEGSVRAV